MWKTAHSATLACLLLGKRPKQHVSQGAQLKKPIYLSSGSEFHIQMEFMLIVKGYALSKASNYDGDHQSHAWNLTRQ